LAQFCKYLSDYERLYAFSQQENETALITKNLMSSLQSIFGEKIIIRGFRPIFRQVKTCATDLTCGTC